MGHGEGHESLFLSDPRMSGVQRLLRQLGGSYRVDSKNEAVSLTFALDDESPSTAALDELTESLFIDVNDSTMSSNSEVPCEGYDLDEEVAETRATLPDSKCMMLISVTASHYHDALEYRVVLPRRIRKGNRSRGVVLDQILNDAAHRTGAVMDVDKEIGTMSLMLTVHRKANETWERTAERGFTTASAAGSRVARSTEYWC
jgi:hypothetical protein